MTHSRVLESHRSYWILAVALAVLAAVGAMLTVPLAAQTPSAADKAVAEATAARKQLLGSIGLTQAGAFEAKPNPAGDYVYEATSAKPLVDGTTFKIEENWMVKGLTVAGVTQGNWPLCLKVLCSPSSALKAAGCGNWPGAMMIPLSIPVSGRRCLKTVPLWLR